MTSDGIGTHRDVGAAGGRYRYESLPDEILPEGFIDELLVDGDGLVVAYPKLFRRIGDT